MLIRFLIISLFSLFSLCLQTGTSFAVDYTTGLKDKEGKSAASPAHPEKRKACTREDMISIRKFSHKAKSLSKEYNELSETEIKGSGNREFNRIMEKMFNYYVSDEYLAMKVVYKRCNIEMPSAKKKKPFWVPR